MAERLSAQGVPGFARAKRLLEHDSTPNILEVVISSLTIMEKQITEMQLAKDPPDLLLRPSLGHIRPMDFHRGAESIAEGRKVAQMALESAEARFLREDR